MRFILLLVMIVFTINGCASVDMASYDKEGSQSKGANSDLKKSNSKVFDKDGYNSFNFDVNGINKFTNTSFDQDGYDANGFNAQGYNKDGYNKYGYDKDGYNMQGIHINTGTEFNPSGYNVKGEKGFTLTFTKDNSYNVFTVVTIKVDGQPFVLGQKRVVLKGIHLIEAQTTRDKKAIKLRNHSESVNVQYDMTVRISDYGIYY